MSRDVSPPVSLLLLVFYSLPFLWFLLTMHRNEEKRGKERERQRMSVTLKRNGISLTTFHPLFICSCSPHHHRHPLLPPPLFCFLFLFLILVCFLSFSQLFLCFVFPFLSCDFWTLWWARCSFTSISSWWSVNDLLEASVQSDPSFSFLLLFLLSHRFLIFTRLDHFSLDDVPSASSSLPSFTCHSHALLSSGSRKRLREERDETWKRRESE